MDGVPIFNLVRETMPAVADPRISRRREQHDELHPDRAWSSGEPFDAALSRMQAAGIAEADPSLDVDGWDAAAKAAALANVLLDARARRRSASRAKASARRRPTGPRAARAAGRRLKLVASGSGRGDRRRTCASQLQELDADDPLAHARWPGERARARHLAARTHRDHAARRRTRKDGVCAGERSGESPAICERPATGVEVRHSSRSGTVSDEVRCSPGDSRRQRPIAARSSASLNPRTATPGASPTNVTGTVRKPRATRSWYAPRSVSTFLTSNGTPARERNSFTCSHGRQLSPV